MRILLAILLLSVAAWGQSTTVTATVNDPNGTPYANASITANIFNPSSAVMNWNNFPLQAITWSSNANSSGVFSFQIPDLNFIGPATGVFYTFTVCANNPNGGIPGSGQPSNPCFTYTSPPCPTSGCITGTTIDISSALTALAPVLPSQGGGSGNVLHCGTVHAFAVYTDTAGVTVTCDTNITSDLSGNESANSITLVTSAIAPQYTSTGNGFLLGPMKTQTTPANPQSGFMTCWPDSTTSTFKCINPDGSNALPLGGGSTFQPQVNGTNTGSTTSLNLLNSPGFNGLSATWSNPSGGANVTLTFTGTLNNSGLTNSSTTVNGQTCTLGGSCSISAGGATAIESLTGDGSDGSVTADGTSTVPCLGVPAASTYTMTRDCYFTVFVVNSGVIIKTASNRILASTSIASSGTIQNAGTVGGGGGAASGTNHSVGGTNGTNSSTLGAGSLAAPLSAGAGKTGATGGTGVGSSGTAGTSPGGSGTTLTGSSGATGAGGGNGGTSGASGGNNAGGTGGAAGSAGTSTLAKSSPHEVSRAAVLYDALGNAFQPIAVNGGAGSGAAGGGDGTNAGGGGGGSGGNGGFGGPIVMISPAITLNTGSIINVSGTSGGVGGAGGTPTTGNCGGGGGGAGGDGGNGGIIVRIYNTLTNSGTDTITGGSGGTGGAAGTGVGTGVNGTAGANGNSGNSGLVFNLQLS